MAIFGPFFNAKFVLNGVDLSDHVASLQADFSVADIDVTAMNAGGAKSRTGGLSDGSLSVTFRQDFTGGKVDATIWTAFTGKAPVTFSFNPTNAANSVSNPNYSGNVLVTDYKPVSGQVGAGLDVQVQWPVSGAVARTTA